MNKIRIGILGLGRIGMMHAENIAAMPEFEIVKGADPFLPEERREAAKKAGVPYCTKDPEEIFGDPDIGAVVIASSTDTHSDFIIRAAKAGKHIFCEKPVDHDVERIVAACRAAAEAGVILQIGFMRRFDVHNRAMAAAVHAGRIGAVETLKITDRDPAPPPMEYIRSSGGCFVDFMVHDFDMARFVLQSEAVEVFATGNSVIDPGIGECGDFGSGHAIVRFENGAIAVIEIARRATPGEDVRMEAVGSKGVLTTGTYARNNVLFYDSDGCHSASYPWHFQEKYKDAYFAELKAFAEAVKDNREAQPGGFDGLQSVLIAEACSRSAKSGRMEPVERIQVQN